MKAAVEFIDDPIELAMAEAALNLAKKRQKWHSIRGFYRPIVNALQIIGIEPGLSSEIDINFSGDAHKLAQVVRILRAAGMQTTATRPKNGDTTWSAYYKHPDCAVDVWLYFTSSVCVRVKVGTKMVEQDIYETRCGEIAAVDELPAPTAPALMDDLPFLTTVSTLDMGCMPSTTPHSIRLCSRSSASMELTWLHSQWMNWLRSMNSPRLLRSMNSPRLLRSMNSPRLLRR